MIMPLIHDVGFYFLLGMIFLFKTITKRYQVSVFSSFFLQNPRKAPKKKKKKNHISYKPKSKKKRPALFLASSIPNLSLDNRAIHVQGPRGEHNADGGLGIEAELIASELGEQVGLAHTQILDQHHLQ